jgi:hypothetical protein
MCIAADFTATDPNLDGAMITPRQVAGLLRIDVETVKLWGTLGVLKDGFFPGGPERFRRAEVLTFLPGRSPKIPGSRRPGLAPAGISPG